MSTKFLSGSDNQNVTTQNLSEGSLPIRGLVIGASNLDPNLPVKTNDESNLYSTNLEITDINNLESVLDNVLTNPFNGTVQATDYSTNNIPSIEQAIQDLENNSSGNVVSTATTSVNDRIVRFSGTDGKTIKGYPDESKAPFINDTGFMRIFANFDQERENSVGSNNQTIYSDTSFHCGSINLKSFSSDKNNLVTINPNRQLGRIQFSGGQGTDQKEGCRVQSFSGNWTGTNTPTNYEIWTTANSEQALTRRFRIEDTGNTKIENGDLDMSSNKVINVADGVNNNDAVNVQQLNNAIGGQTPDITNLQNKTQNIDEANTDATKTTFSNQVVVSDLQTDNIPSLDTAIQDLQNNSGENDTAITNLQTGQTTQNNRLDTLETQNQNQSATVDNTVFVGDIQKQQTRDFTNNTTTDSADNISKLYDGNTGNTFFLGGVQNVSFDVDYIRQFIPSGSIRFTSGQPDNFTCDFEQSLIAGGVVVDTPTSQTNFTLSTNIEELNGLVCRNRNNPEGFGTDLTGIFINGERLLDGTFNKRVLTDKDIAQNTNDINTLQTDVSDRVLKAGDTMTGDLKVSEAGILVFNNSNGSQVREAGVHSVNAGIPIIAEQRSGGGIPYRIELRPYIGEISGAITMKGRSSATKCDMLKWDSGTGGGFNNLRRMRLQVLDGTTETEVVRIEPNRMTVSGDLFVNNIFPNQNGLFSLGSPTLRFFEIFSDSVLNVSDRRLKNNITHSSIGLEYINQLQPKSFALNPKSFPDFVPPEREEGESDEDYNNRTAQKREKYNEIKVRYQPYYDKANAKRAQLRLGFIAQDVKQTESNLGIHTGAVTYDTEDDVYSMNYSVLIPALVNSVKTLSQEVNVLKSIINELTSP